MMKSKDHEQVPRASTPAPWPTGQGQRIWIGGSGLEARRALEKHLVAATRPPVGPLQAAFVTPASVEEAVYFASKLRDRLLDAAALWVVYLCGGQNDGGGEEIDADILADRMEDAGFHRAGTSALGDGLTVVHFRVTV